MYSVNISLLQIIVSGTGTYINASMKHPHRAKLKTQNNEEYTNFIVHDFLKIVAADEIGSVSEKFLFTKSVNQILTVSCGSCHV